MRVKDGMHDALFKRVLTKANLGLGEAYMDGWFDVERLDVFYGKIIDAGLENELTSRDKWRLAPAAIMQLLPDWNDLLPDRVAKHHYDRGNDLFEKMLDSRMNYSCAYWEDPETTLFALDGALDGAQANKLERTCGGLQLEPGMRVLDIGAGFGAFAQYAALNHDVDVTGISVSKEQTAWFDAHNPVPERARILNEKYQKHQGSYDRVVSIGMAEAVGKRNFRDYFKKVHAMLPEGGIFLLHTIAKTKPTLLGDPFISRHIFRDGYVPAFSELENGFDGLFSVEDFEEWGKHYAPTLGAWHYNLNHDGWAGLLKDRYDERFRRMWNLYLLSCKASFSTGKNHLARYTLRKIP